MAENIPNIPAGAVPPKKETGKVQPKKETVRINLPPKPSAAAPIKMPSATPGSSAGAPSHVPSVAAPVALAQAHAAAPHAGTTSTPAAPMRAAAAPAVQRPAPV